MSSAVLPPKISPTTCFSSGRVLGKLQQITIYIIDFHRLPVWLHWSRNARPLQSLLCPSSPWELQRPCCSSIPGRCDPSKRGSLVKAGSTMNTNILAPGRLMLTAPCHECRGCLISATKTALSRMSSPTWTAPSSASTCTNPSARCCPRLPSPSTAPWAPSTSTPWTASSPSSRPSPVSEFPVQIAASTMDVVALPRLLHLLHLQPDDPPSEWLWMYILPAIYCLLGLSCSQSEDSLLHLLESSPVFDIMGLLLATVVSCCYSVWHCALLRCWGMFGPS